MSATSIVLAIDTGSSSIRCTAYELIDKQRPHESSSIKVMGVYHSIPLSCIVPNTGYIRIREILMSIDQCIDNVLSSLRPSHSSYHIVAIGFSSFVMNLVGVDEMGEPVGNEATCSYACNRKDAVDECERVKQSLSAEELQSLYQETGAPLHSAYALPQLLAFYNNDVPNRSKVHQWQTISSICIHRWTGGGKMKMPISYSEASWTGMLDFQTCTWNKSMLHILDECDAIKSFGGILNLFPGLADIDGTITNNTTNSTWSIGIPSRNKNGDANPYWERWPELRGASNYYGNEETKPCRFFLGIGDGGAANCGSKCDAYSPSGTSRRIAVTIGTSAAARVCLPLPIEATPSNIMNVPFGLFCYRVDKSRVLVGGALTDGGSVVEWARNLLNLRSGEDFDAALEEVTKKYFNSTDDMAHESSHSLTMIPFLSGERSTGFRSSASASISGITRDTTAVDILHGCFEGVTLRLGAVINLITEVYGNSRENRSGDDNCQTVLIVSGNALERNPLWRQMIADSTGFNVVVDGDSREGTSRGVARLVAGNIQLMEHCEELLSIVSESKPNPDTKLRWEHATRDQEKLINAVCNTWSLFRG